MSKGQEAQSVPGFAGDNDNSGQTNLVFNSTLVRTSGGRGSASDGDNHGSKEKVDWSKKADKEFEDYVSSPGAYGSEKPLASKDHLGDPLAKGEEPLLYETELEEKDIPPWKPTENQEQVCSMLFY